MFPRFFAGQQDNKNIPICQCWPPSCLVGQETRAFSLISFYRILYQRKPVLECNWMKKKLEVKNRNKKLNVPIEDDFQRRAALPSSEATTSGVAGWNNGAVGEYEEIIDSLMRQISEQPHKVYSWKIGSNSVETCLVHLHCWFSTHQIDEPSWINLANKLITIKQFCNHTAEERKLEECSLWNCKT